MGTGGGGNMRVIESEETVLSANKARRDVRLAPF